MVEDDDEDDDNSEEPIDKTPHAPFVEAATEGRSKLMVPNHWHCDKCWREPRLHDLVSSSCTTYFQI
eukprot:COSAG02_NODE_19517_length_878_cov_1.163030_2_plen_67_part_00